MSRPFYTVGHSNRSLEELTGILADAGIELLADVRKVPGSRAHPQFDEDALAAALREGRVGAAGLDVRAQEPPAADDPLAGLPEVLLTPHIAAVSRESDEDLHRRAAEVLAEVLSSAGHRLRDTR